MLNIFKKSSPPVTYKQQKEEEYYCNLFIRSEHWNKPSPNYEELLRWQIIEKFLYYIKGYKSNEKKKVEKILDLGCGRGWLTNLLSNHGSVKGVEPIAPVVRHANELFPELDIEQGNSKELLNRNHGNSFDLIVCSEVIEHIPYNLKSEFVNDIRLLLNEGGFAIITTPRKDAEDEWKKYIDPNQPIEDWLTEKEMEILFNNKGFTKELIERFSISPKSNTPLIEIYQLWLFKK